ncbi:hypothetical protein H7169_01845 [Candidatus Gracilibacteria bacterium]|nr:hypothetical protein [Candidatus Gracilibacteria bacterium]
MYPNFKTLISSPRRLISYLILVIFATLLWWYSTDIRIMFGNYGNLHTYTDIILSVVMILTFPLFLIALFYKSYKYGKRADIGGKTGTGIIGGIIGTILSGCSCCGLTLAASFGLLPLMSLLPYDGLEVKVLGAVGLLYALWDILKNLESCKIQSKQSK